MSQSEQVVPISSADVIAIADPCEGMIGNNARPIIASAARKPSPCIVRARCTRKANTAVTVGSRQNGIGF